MYTIESHGYAHSTKIGVTWALRRILTDLWEYHGAPKLDMVVPHYPAARPRNVTATRDEIETLLNAAKPSLRLWLLFCSDLALRSGTANKLNGSNYDPERGELRFVSKGQAKQMLPVTEEIRTMLDPLDHCTETPYVWQLRKKEQVRGHQSLVYPAKILRKELKALRLSLGITKRIIPHDLRRTAAVAMLDETHDLRAVKVLLGHSDLKTTLGYLDHDIIHLDQSMLEAIKRPFLVKPKEKTA